MTILYLLYLFVATRAACSDHEGDGNCNTDDDCKWEYGRCVRFASGDCEDWTCRLGCNFTEGVSASCVNAATDLCATGTSADCNSVGGAGSGTCEMTTGTCVFDESVFCPAEVDDWSECPNYCGELEVPFCEVEVDAINCSDYGTDPITECEDNSDICYWSIDKGKCVSNGISDSSSRSCGEYSNDPISECGRSKFCKVSSGSCVSNDKSYPQMDTECESFSGCSLSGRVMCKKSGDKCVFARDEHCALLSTLPITQCGEHPNSCRISAEGCVDLTPAEACSTYSVTTTTECEFSSFCESRKGVCVDPDLPLNTAVCGQYSVLPSSECQLKSKGRCAVNSDGACVPHELECKLTNNPYHQKCNNPMTEACSWKKKLGCQKFPCESFFLNKGTCDNAVSLGCRWRDSIKKCVPSVSCAVEDDGTCSPASCTTISEVTRSCTVDTSVDCAKTRISECIVVPGCKWESSGGSGTCVEKTCASDPSYSRCCRAEDDNCAYCSGLTKPDDCLPITPCVSNPSYLSCCPGAGCTGFCTANPTDSGCASSGVTECVSNPSYSNCCPGAGCTGFCTTNPTDSGCASSGVTECVSNPSYSKCCPGAGCTEFCGTHAEDEGCKEYSGAFRIVTPFISLLLLLVLL